MSKNAQIESGKACSLADLFCDDNKVVIPDLQRDYCWGKDAWIEKEERFADLVPGFVKRLFDLYSETSGQGMQTLGLIYGYEEPKGHIQICDGQQRLTTLFLLLGYVNTKAGYEFSDYLMSKEEREDDNETHLQYAIRESTLYFLSDLTKEVFVDGSTSLESMLRAYRHESGQRFPKWYFSDYDLDASIQNMLAALNSINCVANDKSFNDWKKFAKFLLQNLQFLYYDMGTRSRGEETYVVINTTGEPLSPAENIKPIVIGRINDVEDKKKCSDEWEEREDWFWKNRGDHKTSDINVYRFLVWYWQIGLLQERAWKDKVSYELSPRELFLVPPRPVTAADEESASVDRWEKFRKSDTIHVYFKALQKLVAIVSQDDSLKTIFRSVSFGLCGDTFFDGTLSDFFNKNRGGQNIWQFNMILPALAYLVKYPNAMRLPEFIARLRKNYFDLRRVRNPLMQDNTKSGSYVDWRHVIQIVEMSENEEDVFAFDTLGRKPAFKNIPNVQLNEWYGQPQKDYRSLMSAAVDVSRWEGHPALMGDLTPLVVASEGDSIDFEKTKRRWANLNTLSICIRGNTKDESFNPDVANWYRLYRVLVGIIPIGHQSQTPWNLVGCYYSRCFDCLQSDFAFLKTRSYSEILDSADLLHELRVKCVEILKSENLLSLSDSMDATHLLKAFLAAKTLCNAGTAIEFYDKYAISVDTSMAGNKINSMMPLAWGNLICRYGYKLGWKKTGHNGSAFLDTILADDSGVDDTTSFSPEKVNETTQIVESLIKSVLNVP
ncbi:MAG: DUF262 domain-containing protein [Kiritimatiellae bacterium]|nr:DUF262 domain-containing protein [Kiritimatiellia bacterium]